MTEIPKDWIIDHSGENKDLFWVVYRANKEFLICVYSRSKTELKYPYFVVYEHWAGEKERRDRFMPVYSVEDVFYILENKKYPPPTRKELEYEESSLEFWMNTLKQTSKDLRKNDNK